MNVGARDTLTSRDTRGLYNIIYFYYYFYYYYYYCVYMKTGTMTTTILKMRRCVCRLAQTGSPSIGQIRFKPIYIRAYYIGIYWYLCLPVSVEAAFQI